MNDRLKCPQPPMGLWTHVTGQTPDISEWLDFSFYDLVWFHQADKPGFTKKEHHHLGRWLGISHRIGSDFCYWILTQSGHVISTITVQHVTHLEANDGPTKAQIETFNQQVNT